MKKGKKGSIAAMFGLGDMPMGKPNRKMRQADHTAESDFAMPIAKKSKPKKKAKKGKRKAMQPKESMMGGY